jgi:hypothetical protein
LAIIIANELVFQFDKTTTLEITPEMSVVPIFTWVAGEQQLWTFLLVMPDWIASDDAVELTLTSKEITITGSVSVELLPF